MTSNEIAITPSRLHSAGRAMVLFKINMWGAIEVGAGFPLLTPAMQAGKGSHVIIYMARRAIQGDD